MDFLISLPNPLVLIAPFALLLLKLLFIVQVPHVVVLLLFCTGDSCFGGQNVQQSSTQPNKTNEDDERSTDLHQLEVVQIAYRCSESIHRINASTRTRWVTVHHTGF